jgi:ATP-dependent protease ClpP protease subunit
MDARARNIKIDTMGFGDVHSAAVLVFAAGRTRALSKFASVLVHESSIETEGSASDIKKQAKQLENDEEFWCNALAALTGTDAKTWMKLHGQETFLTPDEALKLNLATELV